MAKRTNVTIGGATMTIAAARNLEETGTDVAADLAALRAGTMTRDALLAHCLNGADEDRVEGWREYVEAVSAAAQVALVVVAKNVRATDTGVRGGKDVDIAVTLASGETVRGEITMVRGRACPTMWVAYGQTADTWVSGPLLARLIAELEPAALRAALKTIEEQAAAAIEVSQ